MTPAEMDESLLGMMSSVNPTSYDLTRGKQNSKYTVDEENEEKVRIHKNNQK